METEPDPDRVYRQEPNQTKILRRWWKMSQETIEYQARLIKRSIAILKDALNELEQGIELSKQSQENITGIVLKLEDVRDIAFAVDNAKKKEIMN
jgi:exonuclease VII small subunit